VQKLEAQKLWMYFRRLRNSMATLTANISGMLLDKDVRKTALEITKGPYIVSKFQELWSTND